MALARAISRINPLTSLFWLGSKPSVGSSRIRTSGSCNTACAKPTRLLNPFDNVSIGCPSTGPNPSCSTTLAIPLLALSFSTPRTLAVKRRNSNGFMSPYNGAPSGKYPKFLRANNPFSETSCPHNRTVPEVGERKPVIIRMVVDLPAPLGPRKPRTSPRCTLKETESTAWIKPNRFDKDSTSIKVAIINLSTTLSCLSL